MRFLKALLIVVGLVAVVAGAVFVFQSWIDIRSLVAVANANKNQGAGIASPFPKVGLAAGAAALGAFLLGAGVALPRLTERGVRRQVLEAQRAGLNRELDAEEYRTEHPERGARRQRPADTDAAQSNGSHGAADAR